VIRAILHMPNDQPLAVELLEMPTPADVAVVCTNVRTVDGKRPVFIDFSDSTFVFPVNTIRFLEIPRTTAEAERAASTAATAIRPEEPDELEIDEDFLRKVREA
jgi:hypothetical protein